MLVVTTGLKPAAVKTVAHGHSKVKLCRKIYGPKTPDLCCFICFRLSLESPDYFSC